MSGKTLSGPKKEKKVSLGANSILATQIFDALAKIEAESKDDSLYVDSEFDSNQTKYEQLSNTVQIAVRAKSDSAGFVLGQFLRAIIDKHSGGFEGALESYREEGDDQKGDEMNISLLIAFIKCFSESSIEKMPIIESKGQKFSQTLQHCGDRIMPGGNYEIIETVYSRTLAEIDVWDLERIRKELKL